MTYLEALESLADDLHAWRYKELTAEDHENPRVRDAWRERVVRMASGQPEPSPEARTPAPQRITQPSAPDPWLPLIRACEDHNPGCCSHPAAFCSRFAKDVSREDCIACLKNSGVTAG